MSINTHNGYVTVMHPDGSMFDVNTVIHSRSPDELIWDTPECETVHNLVLNIVSEKLNIPLEGLGALYLDYDEEYNPRTTPVHVVININGKARATPYFPYCYVKSEIKDQ